MRNLAKDFGIAFFLVAHPKASIEKDSDGRPKPVGPYDISGGAMFINKCDMFLSIWRDYSEEGRNVVHVLKVKKRYMGKVTDEYGVAFEYDKVTGSYDECSIQPKGES